MTHRKSLATACLLVLATIARAGPEDAGLAEQFNRVAAGLAAVPGGTAVGQATADVAERLIDNDLRLLRQAIDNRLSLGQRDQAIELLARYRKLDIDDELSQIQYIDLLTDRMQSAEERVKYLERVVDAQGVSPVVRGHAAVLLSNLLRDRGDDAAAETALQKALQLSPMNPRALQLSLDRALAGADAAARARAAVALIDSNPMQPATMALLAEELARAGAINESTALYQKAFATVAALGYVPAAADAVNAAAVWLAAGNLPDAQAATNAANQVDPTFAPGWFMKLLLAGQNAQPFPADAAREALTRNVMYLHAALAGRNESPDSNAPARLPDVAKDAQELQARGDGQLAGDYANALGDLAWLDAYFTGRAPDPAVMAALKALTGDSSVLVTRIEGFAALSAGQPDRAKVKLQAIADRDALARLGLLKLRLDAGDDVKAIYLEGSKLLHDLPVGVWSASIRTLLANAGKLDNRTPDAQAVIAETSKLDDTWLDFPRQGGRFYYLSARAQKAGVRIGEPMILTVSVQNAGNRPLVIGPGGVIDQNIAIDASLRGAAEQQFPAAALARLTRKIVLGPRETVMANVRIDNPQLTAFLNAGANVGISVFTSAVTNPRQTQQGVLPGPGGIRHQTRDVIDRRPESLFRPEVAAEVQKELVGNDPVGRVRAARVLGANLALVRAATDPNADLRKAGESLEAQLRKLAADDASAAVRATALQELEAVATPAGHRQAITDLLKSGDFQARAIGCLLGLSHPQAERKEMLVPVLDDADDAIKRLAHAVLDLPDFAPATQPAE